MNIRRREMVVRHGARIAKSTLHMKRSTRKNFSRKKVVWRHKNITASFVGETFQPKTKGRVPIRRHLGTSMKVRTLHVCFNCVYSIGSAHTDHCKKCGNVLGELCMHCNTGIGAFDHNVEKMKKAIAYVSKHPCYVPPLPTIDFDLSTEGSQDLHPIPESAAPMPAPTTPMPTPTKLKKKKMVLVEV